MQALLHFYQVEWVMPQLFFEPSFWSATVLICCLTPSLCGMLFGTPKGRLRERVWLYRGAGVEILFVLLPFVFYGIGNSLNGSYAQFMASPELPMAAMVLFAMTIFSMLKGIYASQGRVAIEAFLIGTVLSVFLMMSCGAYISWLAFRDYVSPWFGVVNSVLIVVAVLFSFAITASMSFLAKSPESFGAAGET
ncbi:hypothetical protein [Pseudomonas lactucae]|uniref:Uncharacterized protein n=1 Tax=Pseudomonas lactucae TaxID=2813360 RepID=A0A9X0YBD4_9PSED|nr:hypothetical protein [Pseudomonas lactucae]MBN2976885.1 hypothetical protein [Pseudomonas lactucae]MBN2986380.1 hypothetical protein [Pseudomonas lactucae]